MKISIIVPVHNLGEQITQCLNSIVMQDFDKTEFEVIITLDACTDNSEFVIRQWSSDHPNVNLRIFYSQCHTPGGARNVGLDNATGEYIMFIDGDDWLINSSALSILFNAVQGHNAVRMMDHEMRGTHVKFSNRLTLWLHFFSKQLIGSERFTDLLLCEDYEFVKRVRNKPGYNENIVYIPLYYYNYDHDRMLQRLKDVHKASFERKRQGLPPLHISDEFVINVARDIKINCSDKNAVNRKLSCSD